jgi:hypothetical protein
MERTGAVAVRSVGAPIRRAGATKGHFMKSMKRFAVALMVVSGLLAGPARADDLAALKAELDGLKSEYASRIAALEARIKQLETQATVAAVPAPSTPPSPPPSAPASAGGRGTAFNPTMSVILAGTYAHLSEDPATYRIAGFVPSGPNVGPGDRSFNLGESELTLAANVDPYFYANLTASILADDTVSVEEAYFRTTALTNGFTIKGGRFFSGIGYLNDVHAHAWDFVDQPLVYQAFLDSQLTQDGVQAKWLAPTDTFIEVGVETGNGDTFPGTRRTGNGPNGGAAFVHVGDDVGDSVSWRAGLSWLDRQAENRAYPDQNAFGQPVVNAFSGSSRIWAADATFKWAPHGNPTEHLLKLQAEYMRRTEDGTLTYGTAGSSLGGDFRSVQSGWYVQGVYGFRPRWRTGLRYDYLDSGSTHIGLVTDGQLPGAAFPILTEASPRRLTWMLDWSPSEFSRLRAQYAWDDARASARDRQIILQYLYSIGAHGAHKY